MNGDLQRSELDRIYWHSRRGMLELDLVLMPFARDVYPSLPAAQRAEYRELLACEDADLYRWLVAGDPSGRLELQGMIDRVIGHGRSRTAT